MREETSYGSRYLVSNGQGGMHIYFRVLEDVPHISSARLLTARVRVSIGDPFKWAIQGRDPEPQEMKIRIDSVGNRWNKVW